LKVKKFGTVAGTPEILLKFCLSWITRECKFSMGCGRPLPLIGLR